MPASANTTFENQMPPADARILVAMSGGVDSVAAAAVLVRSGYTCMGATLRMTAEPESKPVFEPCCGLQAVADAKNACDRLGMEHRTIRIVEAFDQHIIAPFVREYAAGRTPNPCIRCNRMIKFGLMYQYARRWGFDYIAMGHYVLLTKRNGRMALRRSAYREKDQSYVLAPLTQPQLRRSCFPLGAMTKSEARALAATVDAGVGAKAESQEICFVADRNYARIVEERGNAGIPGNIVDVDGNVLGIHKGIHHYTIGQRRGLGISASEPLYIIRIDPENNTIMVGRNGQFLCGAFDTGPLFWGGLAPCSKSFRARVQLRYRHHPVQAEIVPAQGSARVVLDAPQRDVTPGQWAVFYDEEDYVLASGKILAYEMENQFAT